MGTLGKAILIAKLSSRSWITFAALLLICAKYFWNFSNVADVSFVDEHGYLLNGINFNSTKPSPESGPIYSLLFYLFHFLVTDLPTLQHVVTVAVSVACVASFFLLLRELNVPLTLALFFTWCYLISPLFVPVFPKVGFLANAVFFVSAIFFIRTQSLLTKVSIASIAFLLMTYIRPESKLSLGISLLIVVFIFLIKTNQKRNLYSFLLTALVTLLAFLWMWLGNPFSDNSNRTYLAFGQHYALNKSKIQPLNSNPFVDWEDYNTKYFNGAKDIVEAVKTNPREFAWHIYTNFRNYLWVINEYGMGVVWPSLFFGSAGKFLPFIFLLFFLPPLFKFMKESFDFNFLFYLKQRADVFLFCLLCWLPMVLGQLIVAPRHHTYAYQMMFPILVGATVFYFKSNTNWFRFDFEMSFLLAILLFIVTPIPFENHLIDHGRQNISVIERLRATGKANMQVLDPIGACAEFTGTGSVTIKPSEKKEDFDKFIMKQKIDVVIVCRELIGDKRYTEDPSFELFLVHPEQFGFAKKLPSISQQYFLYIKN
jgi:hypothetical protein